MLGRSAVIWLGMLAACGGPYALFVLAPPWTTAALLVLLTLSVLPALMVAGGVASAPGRQAGWWSALAGAALPLLAYAIAVGPLCAEALLDGRLPDPAVAAGVQRLTIVVWLLGLLGAGAGAHLARSLQRSAQPPRQADSEPLSRVLSARIAGPLRFREE